MAIKIIGVYIYTYITYEYKYIKHIQTLHLDKAAAMNLSLLDTSSSNFSFERGAKGSQGHRE